MKRLGALFGGCLAIAVAPPVPEERVYVEENGCVCIEAEGTDSTLGDWKKHTDSSYKDWIKGFLGEGCLQFTGNQESGGPPKNGLTYLVFIRKPGKYRLAVRGLEAPVESGQGDKANDCYVRMDGQPDWKGKFTKCVLLGKSFQWSWNVKSEYRHHQLDNAEYDLAAGVHTFQVAGRSKNFFLDRIVLHKEMEGKEARFDSLKPSAKVPLSKAR